MLYRIILYILIASTIINGWWFIALPLLIIGMWKFEFRVELIVAGVMYDALFGMIPGTGLYGYAGTITALIVLIATHILKKVVR